MSIDYHTPHPPVFIFT